MLTAVLQKISKEVCTIPFYAITCKKYEQRDKKLACFIFPPTWPGLMEFLLSIKQKGDWILTLFLWKWIIKQKTFIFDFAPRETPPAFCQIKFKNLWYTLSFGNNNLISIWLDVLQLIVTFIDYIDCNLESNINLLGLISHSQTTWEEVKCSFWVL